MTPEPTPAPNAGMTDEQRVSEYLDINDFESALRTRPDNGSLYTNKIIIGWIRNTYLAGLHKGRELERERIKKVFCSDINGEETWDFYSKYITPSESEGSGG